MNLCAQEPHDIKNTIELHKAEEARRTTQQGKGRPIISFEFKGYRLTAVGNELHYSKSHRTFVDFLDDYINSLLGRDWGNAELAKPENRQHPLLQWYKSLCVQRADKHETSKEGIQTVEINGLIAAYYGLAYNLYLLKHNVELQEHLIRRLKLKEHFYAAYYETFVSAWFILAGFDLHLENEQDPSTTHPEFIASRDGLSYSVEAKTRKPNKGNFDIGNQLYKALSIEAHHQRVVFIDINVGMDADFEELKNEVLQAVKGREEKLTINGQPAPSALLFVTNQPYHLALAETNLIRVNLPVGYKIVDFGFNAFFHSYTDAYKARIKYSAMNDVREAMINYNIPTTFDGELPAFKYGEAKRRFNIGEQLEVSKGKYMLLKSGIVAENERKAVLILQDDNQEHIYVEELFDSDIAGGCSKFCVSVIG